MRIVRLIPVATRRASGSPHEGPAGEVLPADLQSNIEKHMSWGHERRSL
jgi:hypothetical protein